MTKEQLQEQNEELKWEIFCLKQYQDRWQEFTQALENIIEEIANQP